MSRTTFLVGGGIPLLMLSTIDGLWRSDSDPALEPPFESRTFDGSLNHREDPRRGAAGEPFARLTPAFEPIEPRPSPRAISNAIHAQPDSEWTTPDSKQRSILFALFGQFLSHDISLRAKEARPRFVRVGPGDPTFAPDAVLPFASSARHPTTGIPFNRVSAWIDASMVYGSDRCRAAVLREFAGGRLRTSPGDQLPRYGWFERERVCSPPGAMVEGCPLELEVENPRREPLSELFLAGDVRANENPVLLSLHTLFVREHNRYAARLARRHPSWSDERLYQEARRWVGALVQAITFNEYLPLLLGPDALPPVAGYDPSLAGQISLELAMAAFRFGHSQMGPMLYRNGPDGAEFEYSDVSLKAAFYATPLYEQAGGGPGAWLAGAASFRAQTIDRFIIEDLRNYMFGGLRAGLDVATINIAVGRDAQLGSLAALRSALGLPPLGSFGQLTGDAELARRLDGLYGRLEAIDPWVAMLVEAASAPREASVVGSTLRAVLVDGFRKLRDGDRFHYARDPGLAAARAELERTRLADVIRRNLRGDWTRARWPDAVFVATRGHRGFTD